MTHRKDFFEDFTDDVDGAVYFVDQSKIKPSGLGTIRLKTAWSFRLSFASCSISPTAQEKLVVLGPLPPARSLHSYV